MTEYVYVVHYDVDGKDVEEQFETYEEALEYAKARIDQKSYIVEVGVYRDDFDNVEYDQEKVWSYMDETAITEDDNKPHMDDEFDDSDLELNESQAQEISGCYARMKDDYGVDVEDLVYGDGGFMKTKYPDGFPDFAGDLIYSEKYWNEFIDWLKNEKGIELHEDYEGEDEQKLYGTDNAIVPCKRYKLIAHSEDEKPTACDPYDNKLEKPLTEDIDDKHVRPLTDDDFEHGEVELGYNCNDSDIQFDGGLRFADNGVYSDTSYVAGRNDDGTYYLQTWYNSDDGDQQEGDCEEFNTLDELNDYLKDLKFVEVSLKENLKEAYLEKYKPAEVTADDGETTWHGYLDGSNWNGWDSPWFEKDVADKIAEHMNAQGEYGVHFSYDEEEDRFVCEDDQYPGEPSYYKGEDHDTEDGMKHLYPIGAWEWCWYSVDDDMSDEAFAEACGKMLKEKHAKKLDEDGEFNPDDEASDYIDAASDAYEAEQAAKDEVADWYDDGEWPEVEESLNKAEANEETDKKHCSSNDSENLNLNEKIDTTLWYDTLNEASGWNAKKQVQFDNFVKYNNGNGKREANGVYSSISGFARSNASLIPATMQNMAITKDNLNKLDNQLLAISKDNKDAELKLLAKRADDNTYDTLIVYKNGDRAEDRMHDINVRLNNTSAEDVKNATSSKRKEQINAFAAALKKFWTDDLHKDEDALKIDEVVTHALTELDTNAADEAKCTEIIKKFVQDALSKANEDTSVSLEFKNGKFTDTKAAKDQAAADADAKAKADKEKADAEEAAKPENVWASTIDSLKTCWEVDADQKEEDFPAADVQKVTDAVTAKLTTYKDKPEACKKLIEKGAQKLAELGKIKGAHIIFKLGKFVIDESKPEKSEEATSAAQTPTAAYEEAFDKYIDAIKSRWEKYEDISEPFPQADVNVYKDAGEEDVIADMDLSAAKKLGHRMAMDCVNDPKCIINKYFEITIPKDTHRATIVSKLDSDEEGSAGEHTEKASAGSTLSVGDKEKLTTLLGRPESKTMSRDMKKFLNGLLKK